MRASLKWLLVQWDAAHLLELGVGDVRADKTGTEKLNNVEWYKPLMETLSLLLNAFQYGKGYEEIRQIAAELLIALRNPAKLCETRFAASEKKVLESFLCNYIIYVQWYKEASTIPEGATTGKKKKSPRTKRNADEESKLAYYNQLRDMMFVGRLLVLRDLFQHISEFSLLAQVWALAPPFERTQKLTCPPFSRR